MRLRSGRTRHLQGDDGVATVLVLTLAAVLGLLSALVALLGSVAVGRHRAASAADLAALAAASRALSGEWAACAAAREVAAGAGAAVRACRLEGDVAVVIAVVPSPPGLRLFPVPADGLTSTAAGGTTGSARVMSAVQPCYHA